MRRIATITALLLLVSQAMAASVPMLHPAAPAAAHAKGKHDCCPSAKVRIMECCPRAVGCPHQHHGGACCCSGSSETPAPARMNRPEPPLAIITQFSGQAGTLIMRTRPGPEAGPPLDNSPPVLVLRN